MFGIGFHELLIILLLMVIFIKPKDIPSVVKSIAKVWKSIRKFMLDVKNQISNITHEIDNTHDDLTETFHDKIEKLRLEINNEPDFFDLAEKNNTPKLKIEPKQRKCQKK